jgi:hypothetical protein
MCHSHKNCGSGAKRPGVFLVKRLQRPIGTGLLYAPQIALEQLVVNDFGIPARGSCMIIRQCLQDMSSIDGIGFSSGDDPSRSGVGEARKTYSNTQVVEDPFLISVSH